MKIRELENNFISFFIENGRKDLANLYYLHENNYTWIQFKELITITNRDFLKLEEKSLIEFENSLKEIENKFSLTNDTIIDKFIYDLVFLTLDKITDKVISENFLPVMQNNGLFDMLFNMPNISKNLNIYISENNIQVITKLGNIQLRYNSNVISRMIKTLSNSQIQLLCYCIYLKKNKNTNELTLFINDYCELKKITRQTNSVKKILNDFYMLEHIYFTFDTRIKGKNLSIQNNQVLKISSFDTRKNEIKFILGEWANTLSNKQYSLFNKKFFQYSSSKNSNSHTIILSLKFNEIIRNNINKGKNIYCINVGKLIDLLSFNGTTIKAKGFVLACQEPLEQALDEISKNEGYIWRYRNGEYKNFNELKKDYIEFENPKMLETYKKSIVKNFLNS